MTVRHGLGLELKDLPTPPGVGSPSIHDRCLAADTQRYNGERAAVAARCKALGPSICTEGKLVADLNRVISPGAGSAVYKNCVSKLTLAASPGVVRPNSTVNGQRPGPSGPLVANKPLPPAEEVDTSNAGPSDGSIPPLAQPEQPTAPATGIPKHYWLLGGAAAILGLLWLRRRS